MLKKKLFMFKKIAENQSLDDLKNMQAFHERIAPINQRILDLQNMKEFNERMEPVHTELKSLLLSPTDKFNLCKNFIFKQNDLSDITRAKQIIFNCLTPERQNSFNMSSFDKVYENIQFLNFTSTHSNSPITNETSMLFLQNMQRSCDLTEFKMLATEFGRCLDHVSEGPLHELYIQSYNILYSSYIQMLIIHPVVSTLGLACFARGCYYLLSSDNITLFLKIALANIPNSFANKVLIDNTQVQAINKTVYNTDNTHFKYYVKRPYYSLLNWIQSNPIKAGTYGSLVVTFGILNKSLFIDLFKYLLPESKPSLLLKYEVAKTAVKPVIEIGLDVIKEGSVTVGRAIGNLRTGLIDGMTGLDSKDILANIVEYFKKISKNK